MRRHPASTQNARERAVELAESVEPRVAAHRRQLIADRARPDRLAEMVAALLRQQPIALSPHAR